MCASRGREDMMCVRPSVRLQEPPPPLTAQCVCVCAGVGQQADSSAISCTDTPQQAKAPPPPCHPLALAFILPGSISKLQAGQRGEMKVRARGPSAISLGIILFTHLQPTQRYTPQSLLPLHPVQIVASTMRICALGIPHQSCPSAKEFRGPACAVH